ncbi:hypothetical protein J7443_22470 [Tropicibacter sp. R15_0]|uniref:hypothetical protein n=1 Tax=Tropicibacter sp. R15_0 TaxID=2821101 RepID=UPI001ADD1E0C|nr:hypothetical protein [Tropicibacter sp. R15_0]MBO9468013.1 hypothetical protein [Tropicibacter sp. R15_0]
MGKQDWLEVNRPDVWRTIISDSHKPFICTDYLFEMGDVYRREFAGESRDQDVTIPVIPRSVCHFPQADEICELRSGFDLPLLITPKKDWNRDIVAFASQDPLRTGEGWPNSLSMSTPWGFSAQKITSRGGKILWPVVEKLCNSGKGGYFTDVRKLYVHPGSGFKKSNETEETEKKVFAGEVKSLAPKLWVTLGRDAYDALSEARLPDVDRHPHPTAWGHLKGHYEIPDESFATLQDAIFDQISGHPLY